MSDFLGNLVARNLNRAAVLLPRLPSLYEPTLEAGGDAGIAVDEQVWIDPPSQQRPSPAGGPPRVEPPPHAAAPRIAPAPLSSSPSPSPDRPLDRAAPVPFTEPRHPEAVSTPRDGVPPPRPMRADVPAPAPPAPPAGEPAPPRPLRQVEDGAPVPARRGDPVRTEPETRPMSPPRLVPTEREPPRPEPDAEPAPTIQVSIGRIEVRAVLAPAPRSPRVAPAAPRLSLEEYLRARNGDRG
jgi:hypothetical protein